MQLAILTGQSNPASCALSPVQSAFLSRVVAAGAGEWQGVDRNFPYGELGEPHREVPLLPASVANGRQYLDSRGAAFRERHRSALEALLRRAPHTVILAGSCGLELFTNLGLPTTVQARCAILAYGPAARRMPDTVVEVVVGRRDWISPALCRVPAGITRHGLDCGHRDYLSHPAMLTLAIDFVRRVAAGSGVPTPSAGTDCAAR